MAKRPLFIFGVRNNHWADYSLMFRKASLLSFWLVSVKEEVGGGWLDDDKKSPVTSRGSKGQEKRRGVVCRPHTEVSDCSRMTNLWLFGSMNSSPSRRNGSGVTVTTREKSRRRSENTRPCRRPDVTGSSLTKVHWRPLPFCCWYCMVGPGVRYRSRKAWQGWRARMLLLILI